MFFCISFSSSVFSTVLEQALMNSISTRVSVIMAAPWAMRFTRSYSSFTWGSCGARIRYNPSA